MWPDKLRSLLTYYAAHDNLPQGMRGDKFLSRIQARCNRMFGKDYSLYLIDNQKGQLCETYPLEIIIPECEKKSKKRDNKEDESRYDEVNDGESLVEIFQETRYCRARYRFAVPFLIHRGRNLCRGAGLSEKMEAAIKMLALFSKSLEDHRKRYLTTAPLPTFLKKNCP